MSIDTDSMPIDGEHELTVEERRAIRKIIRDQERASWLWNGIRTWFPWVTTLGGALGTIAWYFVTEVLRRNPQ